MICCGDFGLWVQVFVMDLQFPLKQRQDLRGFVMNLQLPLKQRWDLRDFVMNLQLPLK